MRTTLSYKEAGKIIDLYSSILSRSEQLGLYTKFRESELQGYDIFDIDNALKLRAAYRVFDNKTLDARSVQQFEKDSVRDGTAVMSYFNLFAPDNLVQQLDKIDSANRSEAVSEYLRIKGEFDYSKIRKNFKSVETSMSFLKYCLQLDRSDEQFWEKIYDRIGITWDERDEYDDIYFIIANKEHFFQTKSIEDNSQSLNVDIIDIKQPEPSVYKRHKTLIDNIIVLVLLIIGTLFTPVRILTFGALALAGILSLVMLRNEPIGNRLTYGLNYIYIIMYLLVIFVEELGLYISILLASLTLFTLIKALAKSKVAN